MNTPNKLTVTRMILVPVNILVYLLGFGKNFMILGMNIPLYQLVVLAIFSIASITDLLDGKIARKYNLVTTFGKFADPLADKMLVLTSFLILMIQGMKADFSAFSLEMVPMWGVAIILVRELMVSGIRLVAANRGEVIAAGWSGKVKTFVTMIALVVMFLAGMHNAVAIIGTILMYVSVVLTIYSGAEYLYNSRKVIFESI